MLPLRLEPAPLLAASAALLLATTAAPAQRAPLIFVHQATSENSSGNFTCIDHPDLNGDPGVALFLDHSINPGGPSRCDFPSAGVENDHPIGIWYNDVFLFPSNPFFGRHCIFNQDLAAMPLGASFNVVVPFERGVVFEHTASAANLIVGITLIDHPAINGDGSWSLFVTQRWYGTYNESSITAEYQTGFGKWALFNNEGTDIPEGATFNVLAVPFGGNEVGWTVRRTNGPAGYQLNIGPDHTNPDGIFLTTKFTTSSGFNSHDSALEYGCASANGMFFDGWRVTNLGSGIVADGSGFVMMAPGLIFWGGFESGNTTRWSSSSP